MRDRFVLQLVASDPGLFEVAAETLGAANYHLVRGDTTSRSVPDLVILNARDSVLWADAMITPVLIVDLSLFCGDQLISLIERVTGRQHLRLFAQA